MPDEGDLGPRDGGADKPPHDAQPTDGALAADGDAATLPAKDASAGPTFTSGELAWRHLQDVGFGTDGRSPELSVDVPAHSRYVAVRVTPAWLGAPPEQPSTCYQLEQVFAGAEPWVAAAAEQGDYGPVCLDCAQRVQVQDRYGSYVFPNDGRPLTEAFRLRFRVSLRDCATFVQADSTFNTDAPPFAGIEYAVAEGVEARLDARLPLRIALSSEVPGWRAGSLAEEPVFQAALDTLQSIFAAAFISAEVERMDALTTDFGNLPLTFGPGSAGELDRLSQAARQLLGDAEDAGPFVPVILVPCLQYVAGASRQQLTGYTPRIPGGLASTHEHFSAADGVFIQAGSCDPSAPDASPWAGADPAADGARLGRVLAHELGHYLGLYHSDAAQGAHVLDGEQSDGVDMMNALPTSLTVEQARFTDGQRAVLRTHPHLRWPTNP